MFYCFYCFAIFNESLSLMGTWRRDPVLSSQTLLVAVPIFLGGTGTVKVGREGTESL